MDLSEAIRRRLAQERAAEKARRDKKYTAIAKLVVAFIGFFAYPTILMGLLRFLHTQFPAVPAWGYWRCVWILVVVRMAIWGVSRSWHSGKRADA